MSKFRAISAALIIAVVSVVAYTGVARAAITPDTNTDACYIKAKNPVKLVDGKFTTNQNFTYNADGTVTGTFVVGGTDANCKKDASLAVWVLPNGKQYPLENQVFFDSATKTGLGRGTHTLTAKLPCEHWQIDLVEGADPKGINGTANYGNPFDGDKTNDAHMLDTHAAQTTCTEKEVVVEKEVPVEVEKEVVKTKVVTKEVPVATGSAPVKAVPSTGAGSILASTMGLSTSSGLAYNLFRKRRLLK